MATLDAPATEPESEPVLNLDFGRYFVALRKYVWLLAALLVVGIGCAVVYTLRLIPQYEAVASVQIEPRLPDLLGTGDMFNVAAGNTNTAEYYRQQLRVLGSYTLCKETVEQNDLTSKLLSEAELKAFAHDDQLDIGARRLQAMVQIKYPDQDRIMYVHVRDASPEFATMLANAHINTYIAYAKGLLSSSSIQASEALQAKFDEAETKLRAAEDKIYKFQAENDMVAMTLEEHQSLVSQNILTFTQKLNDSRANGIGITARLGEMKKEADEDVLSTPIVMLGDATSFESLRSQYYTEKIKLLELDKTLGVKNPDYIAQKQKVDELFKGLQGNVSILLNGTKALQTVSDVTDAGLSAEIEHYKQEAKKLSPKIVQYNEFMREKRIIEDEYNILRARLSASEMTGSMSGVISNVHPLDPALTPTRAVWPNMLTNVAIGGVAALLLGLSMVFLFVFLDRSIKTAADATNAADVPVLGVIPALTDAEVKEDDLHARDLYIHAHPTSHVAECCRVLRTNLLFSAAGHSLKTLVVCSANAKEGKTTTVMYLGISMAQTGKRILLVDTDMRRPRLHVSTNVAREPGLSNLILGGENYDDVIKPTEVANLYVLPCGPLPPNPAELLMTQRFTDVLAELGKRFDTIILDSPPLQPVTDAVLLAKRAEGVILVARSNRTNRDELRRSARMIRTVGGTIFGLVVNELDRNQRDSYYYYSYYGYGPEKSQAAIDDAAASN